MTLKTMKKNTIAVLVVWVFVTTVLNIEYPSQTGDGEIHQYVCVTSVLRNQD